MLRYLPIINNFLICILQVNSKVIGADVYQENIKQKVDNISVEIRFDHLYTHDRYQLSSPECVFWDVESRGWNRTGCRIVDTCQTSTTCQCEHLTNFAVLMDINDVFESTDDAESGNNFISVLDIMTVTCSSLSVIFLAICIWIFSCVPALKGDRSTIHTNLCCCLLLAHLLLLTGLDATTNYSLCYSIAVSLHFLFLSAFCWMLAEGWHILAFLPPLIHLEFLFG